LYASPSIVRVIESRRVRWEEHVARMVEMKNACKLEVKNQMGKYHLEDLM